MEPPPEIDTSTMNGWSDLFRVGKRFRSISSAEIAQLVSFLTGSLGEFLDLNYESEKMKTLFLANNVYGMHAPPYRPGTAIGLMFHMLSGGDDEVQGFYVHVMGGMGAITAAMAHLSTRAKGICWQRWRWWDCGWSHPGYFAGAILQCRSSNSTVWEQAAEVQLVRRIARRDAASGLTLPLHNQECGLAKYLNTV
jgi:hypothetical protein